ncbi:EamA family transporter [Pseudomonas sp. GD03985]|nr:MULTISPECIES: EamA family transporter [unclassified Pseudomonas]MDH0895569.1 EamA family transporter [Pseudomonas sp. GD03875]MDH1065665.1 EamA family transporter [Pseudomonas sp. GD03985]
MTAIFTKIGVKDVDPDLATLIRTAVVLLVLLPIVWLSGKWTSPWELPPKAVAFLALSALATGASWVCYFRALQLGDASLVAPIDKLSVVLVVLFAVIFLGERPSGQAWFGISLIGAGVIVLALSSARNGA